MPSRTGDGTCSDLKWRWAIVPPEAIDCTVREIVARVLKVDPGKIRDESKFRDDLGADSLDFVLLVFEFENAFDIAIPDVQAAQIRTVGQAIHHLKESVHA